MTFSQMTIAQKVKLTKPNIYTTLLHLMKHFHLNLTLALEARSGVP
jgi:hypothetical protein